MKKLIIGIFVAVILTSMYACSPKNDDKKVTIAYVNWAEGVAMTQLSKVLLEKEGYTVVLKNADVAPVFAAVAGGDADVFLDTWMPVTHKEYLEKFGAKLEVLGTNFDNARIGFVVPESVNINSIDELNTNAALFNGKIVGIDAGAGIMNKAEEAIKAYGLKLELQSASEAAMMATVKKSIDAGTPVIVTGWSPHYMFSNYKLKFLKDPKGIFGDVETIQTVANKDFIRSNPKVTAFFRNFKLNEVQLGSLMGELAGAGDDKAAVEKWLEQNQDLERQLSSFIKTEAVN
ncbi:glycine betaine ABC transporter substrate-binding protein [Pedobacter antarcticus]|uniref:Glycine/betaine ABC transporter n=2 Tax=Pedobacter antarcticus TaxID=34086 RepID=A0A081PBR2_9SPHI|nr:glycine betaine ABC transporter substrate-binding protein [Pedobacter antarcticus]KEQ28135.1 glycine/betaine ABC transporter [Pedobacter antarcticus 4BY]SDL41803.1 glycine betaine/proline transport system substrate-binding protein [Pedobacter antarcticus]SFE43078.1 glycine betaine/proline transport system substrate-binding protein [Pedobacter antarcticus]